MKPWVLRLTCGAALAGGVAAYLGSFEEPGLALRQIGEAVRGQAEAVFRPVEGGEFTSANHPAPASGSPSHSMKPPALSPELLPKRGAAEPLAGDQAPEFVETAVHGASGPQAAEEGNLSALLAAPGRELGEVEPVGFDWEGAEPQAAADLELVALAPKLGAAPEAGPSVAQQENPQGNYAAEREPEVFPPDALTATRLQTFVFAEPKWRSKKLGYLRAGSVVKRSQAPVLRGSDCRQGWYQVEPQGYVCAGNTASLDVNEPAASAARVAADRERGLPYEYGMSRYPAPPLYTRLPEPAEQRRLEGDGRRSLSALGWSAQSLSGLPEFLEGGAQAPTLTGRNRGKNTLYSGRALARSGFAFLRTFEHEGRGFGLTTELDIVPLERVKRIEPSRFQGVRLEEHGLPLAFNRAQAAAVFSGHPKTGLKQAALMKFRDAILLNGNTIRVGGANYLETRDGHWVRDEALTHVSPMTKVPRWAQEERTWLDISILKQTLVAYIGTKPVYATLVSTGADGISDPKESHATIQGQFLIHTKHVTSTMSGREVGDEYELRDVPYVQYFTEGYAFHAAYWHDSFGRPRSHGCINLSPEDARWLFNFTDPPVPPKWHGAMSLREGTLVHIHP